MGLMTFLWFGPRIGRVDIPIRMDSWKYMCLSPEHVLLYGDFPRLITWAFFHSSDYHLYYSLSSFLYKGCLIEQKLGSKSMLALIIGFVFSIGTIFTILNLILGPDSFLISVNSSSCLFGFSPVVFALKAIVNYDLQNPNSESYFFGFRLPTKHIIWIEIAFAHFVSPHSTSWQAHAIGALVGFLYLFILRHWSFTKSFFESVPRAGSNQGFYGSGTWGGNNFSQQFEEGEEPMTNNNARRNVERNVDPNELRRRRVNRLSHGIH